MNTYAYGFMKVKSNNMKHQATFAAKYLLVLEIPCTGTTCWTNGDQSPGGETTDCGDNLYSAEETSS